MTKNEKKKTKIKPERKYDSTFQNMLENHLLHLQQKIKPILVIRESTSGFAAKLFMQTSSTRQQYDNLKKCHIETFLSHFNLHPQIKFTTKLPEDIGIALLATEVNVVEDGSVTFGIIAFNPLLPPYFGATPPYLRKVYPYLFFVIFKN